MREYGIRYHDSPIYSDAFMGYADATFANNDDYKFTSGYVFITQGRAITWRSKKQTTIALSFTEAEYVAISESACKACWLRSLYDKLGFIQEDPTLIRDDNDGSIAITKNPQFHKHTKHIAIRWHWVHDLVRDGILQIGTCRDKDQTTDILTKALPCLKHSQHTFEMGLSMVWREVWGSPKSSQRDEQMINNNILYYNNTSVCIYCIEYSNKTSWRQ